MFNNNASSFSYSCHDAITLSPVESIVASNYGSSIHNCNRTVPDEDINSEDSHQTDQTSGKILIYWMNNTSSFLIIYIKYLSYNEITIKDDMKNKFIYIWVNIY